MLKCAAMSSEKPNEQTNPNDPTLAMTPVAEKAGSGIHPQYQHIWQPPSIGQLQAMLPQYRFIEMLGRGGMGAVYKAVQTSLDRIVAIKILPLEIGTNTRYQILTLKLLI